MKLNVTIEVIKLEDLRQSDASRLPKELQTSLRKMPPAECCNKSILFIDNFPPKIIDSKIVHRYFPMLSPYTFQEALALLRDCGNLIMKRGPNCVRWSGHEFLDRGKTWSPSPHDILSQQKEWYVHSEIKSDPPQTEFPSL